MTDERYTFVEQQRERKSAARGARHRVCGSKSKRCTLPHESLTPAQLKRRNGIVNTYNMNAPHTWAELCQWPEDIRRDYLQRLTDACCPTHAQLAEMLGCSPSSVYNHLKSLRIPRENRRQNRDQKDAWSRFISSDAPESPVSDDLSSNASTPDERESPARSVAEPHAEFHRLSITLTGKPAHVFDSVYRLLGDADYEITVTAVRKEVM